MKPRISVVINTYNGGSVIEETINSILSQTYQNFEIVVVDDCSSDRTVEKVRKLGDSRIRIYVNDKNRGAAYSAQRGVDFSRGEYIAKSDQDDISYPRRLEKQLHYMEAHPDIFICGAYHELYYNNSVRKDSVDLKITRSKEFKYALLFDYICFLHSTFFFRRQEANEKGIKYNKFTFSEDYSFITQSAIKANIGVLPEVLVGYRIHEEQLSNHMMPWKEDKELIQQYAQMLGLSAEWVRIATTAAGGEIATLSDFIKYIQLYYYFAVECGLDKRNSADCCVMRYAFRRGMRRQRQRNIIELMAYILSGLCDWKFLFSEKGLLYMRHCLTRGFRKNVIKEHEVKEEKQ